MDNLTGLEFWTLLPWDCVLNILPYLTWLDILGLMDTNGEIYNRIITNYRPRHFKLNEKISYELFKEILRMFNKQFNEITLNIYDIQRIDYGVCKNHSIVKYLIKIQKYGINIKKLNLIDIDSTCINFKKRWPLFEKLTSFNYIIKHSQFVEEASPILKHLKNLEEISFSDVDLGIGWSISLDSPNLKRATFYSKPSYYHREHTNYYSDWNTFLLKHRKLEELICNYSIDLPIKYQLNFEGIKRLSLAIFDNREFMQWQYIKELKELKHLILETNDVVNIFPLIEEILKNKNLQVIEIHEDNVKQTLDGEKIELIHKKIQKIIDKTQNIEHAKLETIYKTFLSKCQGKYEPCQKEITPII